MEEYREVTKEEFDEFVVAHPELDRNVALFHEPPLVTYNDLSAGVEWPECAVAVWNGVRYSIRADR